MRRFEHYTTHQQADQGRVRRLTYSGVATAQVVAAMLALSWVCERFDIVPVPAPKFMSPTVFIATFVPPPTRELPPAVRADDDNDDENEHETNIDNLDPEKLREASPPDDSAEVRPAKDPDLRPRARPKFGLASILPVGASCIVPGPGCAVGVAHHGARSDPNAARRRRKPFETVQERAIYSPNPDPQLLRQTKTGRFSRRDGVSVVGFCVDAQGKTTKLRTVKGFPGDPGIDAVVRRAVAKWRFRPFRVAGRAMRSVPSIAFASDFSDVAGRRRCATGVHRTDHVALPACSISTPATSPGSPAMPS